MKSINEIIETRTEAGQLTDEEIKDISYGIKNFSPSSMGGQSPEDCEFWRGIRPAMIERVNAIETKKTVVAPTPKTCPNCGAFTFEFLAGSNGICCPECI